MVARALEHAQIYAPGSDFAHLLKARVLPDLNELRRVARPRTRCARRPRATGFQAAETGGGYYITSHTTNSRLDYFAVRDRLLFDIRRSSSASLSKAGALRSPLCIVC